jgi:hypothetical protein
MELLPLVFVGSLIVPFVTQVIVEGRWRARWVLDSPQEQDLGVQGAGAFREGNVRGVVATPSRTRAPWGLRAMAFASWFLGQMAVPGFLLWCLGLLVFNDRPYGLTGNGNDPVGIVVLASFFPGMWCAWLCWSAGCALVRGERERADRATLRAVRFIGGYNALAMVASLAWLWAHPRDEFLGVTAAYCVVSLLHAVAVRATFLRYREQYPVDVADAEA